MSKKKIFNASNIDALRRQVKNALSAEGEALKNALFALFDELESAEEEITGEDLTAKILELVNKQEEVPTAVANELAKVVANVNERVQNAINGSAKGKELSKDVRNSIAKAILNAKGKECIKADVEAVLVKNGISGLTFSDVVDYAIVENWGNLNPLFAQLHETKVSKFFYNSADLKTASLLAKQWDKTGEAEKKIQELQVTGKQILTKYIYKRQQVEQEDLDTIAEEGEESNFLSWIDEELDRMIVNTIVLAILVGDTINVVGDRVTTFETIGNKTTSDVFTSVLNPAGSAVTIADLRRLADSVKNPYGKKKIMCLSTTTLSNVAKFIYSAGGSEMFHSNEDVAKMIGVDELYITDVVNENDGIHAICLLPDGYWYKQRNAISVAYPTWQENRQNYQKERNIGGKIHDLYSTAVLKNA